ncbi:MAG: hypothetical protein ACI867_000289 [Glaciecola sp.]
MRAPLRSIARLTISLVALGLVAAPVAMAQTDDERVAEVTADAWYATPVDAACGLPTGCGGFGVSAPNTQPPNTLHVALSNGQEAARTYLVFNHTSADGRVALGGTLRFWLGDETTGASLPDLAKMRLCLVTESIEDGVESGDQAPPVVECATGSIGVIDEGAVRFDLTAVLAAWADGAEMHGVALLAVAGGGAPGTNTWRAASFSRDADVDVSQRPSVSLRERDVPAGTTQPGPDVMTGPEPTPPPIHGPVLSAGPPVVRPVPPPDPSPEVAPEIVPPDTGPGDVASMPTVIRETRRVPASAVPGVVWVPLGLIVGALAIGNVLTVRLEPLLRE